MSSDHTTPPRTGVLLLAYGTPETPDQVEPYFTHIRGGRSPSPESVAHLRHRYEAVALLQHGDRGGRAEQRAEAVRGGEPGDPAADDGDAAGHADCSSTQDAAGTRAVSVVSAITPAGRAPARRCG